MKLGNIEIVMSMDGVEQSMNLIFVQKIQQSGKLSQYRIKLIAAAFFPCYKTEKWVSLKFMLWMRRLRPGEMRIASLS